MITNIPARRLPGLLLTLAAGASLVFTSCVHNSLSHQALSFNRTVHDHRVDQLLLNVLRASNREPMALTAVTSLSTSNNRRLSLGPVSGTFGLATDLYNGAVSGSASASPNMAITILDDDPDFMKGFVQPVPDSSIRYFLDQGWNAELLAYLLIEEIRNEGSGSLVNDPRDPEVFYAFSTAVRENLRHLEVINEESQSKPKVVTTTSRTFADGAQQTEVKTQEATESVVQKGGLYINGSEATIVLRSPQSVLYYLGELARIQLGNQQAGVIPSIESRGGEEPIFLIEMAARGGATGAVTYRGSSYRIPSNRDSRSLQSLSFVQQLINLQTKTILRHHPRCGCSRRKGYAFLSKIASVSIS